MKKKLLTTIVCVIMCAVMMVALVACNENYKQDAVSTDLSDKTVTSNGGLAVKVGKYLYFINGYAGIDGVNAFGEAVKGAVMRVELVNGLPNRDTLTTIVPKNVYNTNAKSGLVVVGDYIYYTSPSVDKDNTGSAKTSEMWIMRTKLDGTGTQVIAEFEDYTTTYRVAGDKLVYLDAEKSLHAIDLTNKKFKDTVIAEEVTAVTYANYADNANALQNVVFYTKAAENKNETHNEIWAYNGENKKVIDGRYSYKAENLAHQAGYTLAVLDIVFTGNDIMLLYTKSDSGANTTSKGDYFITLNSSLAFDEAKEVRMTAGRNYTAYKFFDGQHALATDSDSIDYIWNENGTWVREEVIKASSATLLDVEVANGVVSVYYTASNVTYKINVLSAVAGGYDVAISSAKTVFNGKYHSEWLSIDKVGSVIYFFNSDVLNNVYYLDLNAVIDRSANSMIASQLGKFNAEDNYAMLKAGTTTEEK